MQNCEVTFVVSGPQGSGKTEVLDTIVAALNEKFVTVASESKSENEIWLKLASKERQSALQRVAETLGDKLIIEYILNEKNQSCLFDQNEGIIRWVKQQSIKSFGVVIDVIAQKMRRFVN